MNWTHEKPTHPGWYWYSGTGAERPGVYEVYEADGALYVQFGNVYSPPVADLQGQFAGPVSGPDGCASRIEVTPDDPDWDDPTKTSNWKHYVSDEVRGMWATFTNLQRRAIIRNAQALADKEDWD